MTIKKKSKPSRTKNIYSFRQRALEEERGTYLKKWTGRKPIALLYPNVYKVGMSSLGFQLVYNILNEEEDIVCERFFLPEAGEPFQSIESGRPLSDFFLVYISVSFEHDYVHIVQMLLAAGINPFAKDRGENITQDDPLVLCGGVVSFMNPEPLAPFVDFFYVGEAEVFLKDITQDIFKDKDSCSRKDLLEKISRKYEACYAPIFYQPYYDEEGFQEGYRVERNLPQRIKKCTLHHSDCAGHSQLLTKEAEFSDLFLTELGRGCSRGCRFCTAGFIYRPPRLWDADAIIAGLKDRFKDVKRVGLLGMEMASTGNLNKIADYLLQSGCSLSFSSLRADRVSQDLIDLLAESNLKSVAIAPDGASERLRFVINKGLREKDLLEAAANLVDAGIFKLKLYLMVGLPTENMEDLQEFIDLVAKIKERTDPISKKHGRICEIIVSVNSFTPKAWTPFQYQALGVSEKTTQREMFSVKDSIKTLKEKIQFIKKGLAAYSNVSMNSDKPENAVFQAVLARGDRRLADVLLSIAQGIPWKRAMKKHSLTPEQYAVVAYEKESFLPWMIIDHGINEDYLWKEFEKSFLSEETTACDTKICRRCGVCSAK